MPRSPARAPRARLVPRVHGAPRAPSVHGAPRAPSVHGAAVVAGLLALACGPAPDGAADAAPSGAPPNVLLVVLDDVGVWDLALYGLGSDVAATPVLDGLAAAGVTFTSVWSNPLCSPTRATILTGRYSFRTGVGDATLEDGGGVAPSEVLIPAALPEQYVSAAIGKWHVSRLNEDPRTPNRAGFDHFAGIEANLPTYSVYRRIVDGEAAPVERYVTSAQVDDALAWLGGASEPWFCHLAFSAAHAPFEQPPAELVSPARHEQRSDRSVFLAMIEALDAELGRLLDTLDPTVRARTTILVVGDNGTPWKVPPQALDGRRVKNSVFEGGIRVPLVASGARVGARGARSDALVGAVDLFATVVELSGAPPAPSAVDSVSFAPLLADPTRPSRRTHCFAEMFRPDGGLEPTVVQRAIRDERFKLHRSRGRDALYDLVDDPLEQRDLIRRAEHAERRDALGAALDALLASEG